ncbi:hypothetical protein Tco_0429272 [Tanacetum coccineum]
MERRISKEEVKRAVWEIILRYLRCISLGSPDGFYNFAFTVFFLAVYEKGPVFEAVAIVFAVHCTTLLDIRWSCVSDSEETEFVCVSVSEFARVVLTSIASVINVSVSEVGRGGAVLFCSLQCSYGPKVVLKLLYGRREFEHGFCFGGVLNLLDIDVTKVSAKSCSHKIVTFGRYESDGSFFGASIEKELDWDLF